MSFPILRSSHCRSESNAMVKTHGKYPRIRLLLFQLDLLGFKKKLLLALKNKVHRADLTNP